MKVVVSCLVAGIIVGLAVPAEADPLKCQRSILKESVKLTRSRLKELRKCEERKLKGQLSPATECTTEPGTAAKIAKAESKLQAKLDKACGGPDRTCGTGDDEPPAGLGWPSLCPEFQDQGCRNAIDGCDDMADCLLCIERAAIEQTRALVYDDLSPGATGDLLTCQRTIGSETRRMLDARQNALRKCWDAGYTGKHANDCPDPGDGKAAAKIAKAESKARTKICRACGGDDRACAGGDDLTPVAIGFPVLCPDVGACKGPVGTLDDLVDCVTCVSGFDGSCTLDAAIPALAPYASECAQTPIVADLLVRVDGTSGPTDLDLGWTGYAHDLGEPFMGRMTLAANDCTGDGNPTFGECTLSGPVRDDADPAFLSSRCEDQPWIQCDIDAECTAAGATGPCQFFFGPPQPIGVIGVTSCVVSELRGPVTGTIDVEAGALALDLAVTAWLHIGPGGPDPCPRCIGGTCDAGPRDGMPCTVHGYSPLFDDDVSLDCPPDVPTAGIEIPVTIPLATGVQQATLTAAHPSCSGAGASALHCYCNTCATPNAELCMTDADCPGATAGSCGGLRCLGGSNPGTPCTIPGPDPICDGGPCSFLGEPTAPNPCADRICVPTAGDEGECTAGPVDLFCGPTETYRGCFAPSDCPFPGDTCNAVRPECFPGDGTVGGTVTATGSPDPPLNGLMNPTLGGLFCVPPVGANAVNSVRGLPGLGRLTTAVSVSVVQP